MSDEDVEVVEPEEALEAAEPAVESEVPPTEAPASVATEPAPEPEIPRWMADVLAMGKNAPMEQQNQAQPVDLQNTMLDEDTLKVLQQMIDSRVGGAEEKAKYATEALRKLEEDQVRRELAFTMEQVHKNLYLDQFAQDPVLQGNRKAAEAADGLAKGFISRAALDAHDLGDRRMLAFARTPAFGKAVAELSKILAGAKADSTPVVPKGATVESSSKSGKGESDKPFTLTKSDREAMKKYGLTEEQIYKAAKRTGNTFSDYDYEE